MFEEIINEIQEELNVELIKNEEDWNTPPYTFYDGLCYIDISISYINRPSWKVLEGISGRYVYDVDIKEWIKTSILKSGVTFYIEVVKDIGHNRALIKRFARTTNVNLETLMCRYREPHLENPFKTDTSSLNIFKHIKKHKLS